MKKKRKRKKLSKEARELLAWAVVILGMASVATFGYFAKRNFGVGMTHEELVHFNDTLVTTTENINNAMVNYRNLSKLAAEQIGRNEFANLADLRHAYDRFARALREAREKTQNLKIPNSQSAKDFFANFQRMLTGMESNDFKDLASIPDILADASLQPLERKAKVHRINADAATLFVGRLDVLQPFQNKFAKEHGIKLEQ